MNRALLALFLAASMVAAAQEPKAKPADPKTAAELKAEKKAKKAAEKKQAAEARAVAAKPVPPPAPAPAAKPGPAPAAAKAATPRAAATSIAIVANKDSKTFHRADCKSALKMKEANRTSFASAAEADRAGYKACKVCKP